MRIAKVAVDLKQSEVDVLFDYLIPTEYDEYIFKGSRVIVEFGYRKILGYVIDIVNETDYTKNLKKIEEVVDFAKELNDEQLELAKYISINTPCLLTSALQSMVPGFLRTKQRKYLNVLNYEKMDAEIAYLLSGKKRVLITKEILNNFSKINKEIAKGNIEISYDAYAYGKRRVIKRYSIDKKVPSFYDFKSEKKKNCLFYLEKNPNSTIDDIITNVGVSEVLVSSLVKDGYIEEKYEYSYLNSISEEKSIPIFDYSFVQNQVITKFNNSNKPVLLYTNDERFKLQFLLNQAINNCLDNKKVLIVTPSVLSNLEVYNYFIRNAKGFKTYDFSSEVSNSDFYQGYMAIKNNDVDIVITTKIGVSLPIENLGLIVLIDEESRNYQFEQTPKYSVKEILKFRSEYHKAKLLYTSYAPSIEEYYNCEEFKTTLCKYVIDLKSNYRTINIKDEILNESSNIISTGLANSIRNAMENKTETLLILNSKGYSKRIVCRECGEVLKCPKCKISLTVYKDKGYAKCGYCDYKVEDYKHCQMCGSNEIQELGFGLEKIKEQLEFMFPIARIIQIDSEQIKSKADLDEALLAIEDGNVDIIIGTNIINRISNDDKIGLIGIIDADSSLGYNDYRSSEACYQSIYKAMSHPNCLVIIQGYNFDHYAIKSCINGSYDDFYENEIKYRKLLNYSPFMEVNKITVCGEYKEIYHYANYFKKIFNTVISTPKDILGPVYIPRNKGIQLIVKHNDFEKVKKILLEVNKKFADSKININYERYPYNFS